MRRTIRLLTTAPKLGIFLVLLGTSLGLFVGSGTASAVDAQLSGRVTDQSGAGILGATIDALLPGTQTVIATATSSGSPQAGHYALALPTGTYDIRVTPGSGSSLGSAILLNRTISADTALDVVLVPAGANRVSGRVTDVDGAGIPNVRVALRLQTSSSDLVSMNTGGDGSYTLTGVAGTYNVVAISNNTPSALKAPSTFNIVAPVTLSGSVTLDFPVPAKRVEVTVQNPAGQPVSSVSVNGGGTGQVPVQMGSSAVVGAAQDFRTTDQDGKAVMWLFATPAPVYRFTLNPPAGSVYAQTTINNVPIQGDGSLALQIQEASRVSGRVTDVDGAGIPNVRVALRLQTSSSDLVSMNTGGDGSYTLTGVAGTYNVVAISNNTPSALKAPSTFNIVAPVTLSGSVTLDFPVPAKRVEVTVQNPAGQPVSSVSVNGGGTGQVPVQMGSSAVVGAAQDFRATDQDGKAVMWLFATPAPVYRFILNPPAGSVYAQTTINNVPIQGDVQKTFVLISTDTTPPTITASATSNGSLYVAGSWTNAPVTVHFTCSDAQSGIASCPADQTFSGEGTFNAPGTATDNGGNSASTTFGPIKIDLTPPILTSTVSPVPGQPAGHFIDWTAAAPMPTARAYAGTVSVGGFIYVIGGADPYPTTVGANERYDPATNTWTSLAPMPTPRAGTAVVAGPDGKISVIGGWTTGSDSLSTVEVYDPASNTWSSRPNAPVTANGMATATAANGDIYLFGGYPGCCFNYLANVYRYDPVAGTYTPRASMPTGRQGARAILGDDGKIYLFGGNGSPAVNGKEVSAYDPVTNSWQNKSPMPFGVTYAAGFEAANGRMYIFGARDSSGARMTMEYNPVADSWAVGEASPVSAVIQSSASTAADEYFLFGGVDPMGANPLAGLSANSRGRLAELWTSGPVTVSWICSDQLSGVNLALSDLADDVFNVSGTASATCFDNAANSVSSTRSVTISAPADTTPPELTATATKADGSPYTPGTWANQVVTVHYTCTDAGSGVNASASDLSDDVEPASGTATATCVDYAGNQTVSTVEVLVDRVTTVHYAATVVGQAPWNDTGIDLPAHAHVAITASGIIVIAGSDGGHDPNGIPGCYEGFTSSPGGGLTCLALVARVGNGPVFEVGAANSFSVASGGRLYLTINDSFHGDNSGAWSAGIDISLGAPEIYASATKADGQPYPVGTWTNGSVTVHFACFDGESGIAQCPADQSDTTEGISYVTGTATDLAGNSASTRLGPIRIDTGAPFFTRVTYTRGDGSPYLPGTWTNQAVTVSFACSDLASGVANCPANQTFSAEGSYAGTVFVTDNAGNQGSTTFGPILIDNLGANTTIHVVDHNGAGLSGATASAWYSGAWHALAGVSDSQGRLPAGSLPKVASLQVAVTFNGTRLQLDYAQLTSSDFTFQARLVTMQLSDSASQPLDVGSASYYAGSWRTAGNTSGGLVTVEMLPGSYSFAMVYNGTRVQLTQDIGANPVVAFHTVAVTVRLSSSQGAPLDGGAASYYAGSWRAAGDTSGGQVRVELLPGNYTFAMVYLGTRTQFAQDIGANPVVTFTTGKVHSASGTATSYYAGTWRPFSQDMELLGGSYTFAFSGAPNKSQIVVGGVVNVID